MNPLQTDKLRDYQVAPARHLLDVLSGGKNAIDLSFCGFGKTFTACSVLAAMDKPTLVVVPKSAIRGWKDAAAHFGTSFDVLNYEMLRTGRIPYGVWEHQLPKAKATYSVCANCQCVIDGDSPPCYCRADGMHDLVEHMVEHEYGRFMWHPGIDTLVFDECFPGGTEIRTCLGTREISSCRVGEWVITPGGPRRIVRVIRRRGKFQLCRVIHSMGEFWVTYNHKVLTSTGWKRVSELIVGDFLVYDKSSTPAVREGFPEQKGSSKNVQPGMPFETSVDPGESKAPIRKMPGAEFDPRAIPGCGAPAHDHKKSNVGPGCAGSCFWEKERASFSGEARWKRNGNDDAPKAVVRSSWGWLASRIQSFWGWLSGVLGKIRLADNDCGFGLPGKKDSSRTARKLALLVASSGAGCPKESDAGSVGMEPLLFSERRSVTIFGTDCPAVAASPIIFLGSADESAEVWNLEVEGEHLYELRNGEIVSNCHRCGAADSLQSRMLIAARRDGKRVLCLSATAACSPVQMRALGYVLGLHTLTEKKDKHGSPFYATGLSFYQWARRYGCQNTTWGGFQWLVSNEARQRSIMADIRESLVPGCGVRVCVDDVPNFPTRSIHCKLYDIEAADKVDKLYDQMAEPLAALQERKEKDVDPDNPLTAILRARQEVELLKVPVFEELARDYLEKGCSVAVFVNFTETISQLSKRFADTPHGVIDGVTKDRDNCVHGFEHDIFRLVLVNTAAGSEAIGLRDLRGVFPRVGLVSPTFSARTMRQIFGRLPRDGSKSHSTYYVVFAADTVEEDICCSAGSKMDNVDALNDADLTPKNLLEARSKRRANKAAEKIS